MLIGLYIGAWCGDGTQYYDEGYVIKIFCHRKHKKMIRFFRTVLAELFGKTVTRVVEEKGLISLIKFKSKFISSFVFNYVQYNGNKANTVGLKDAVIEYSPDFLRGFMLGLALTDGYLKERFMFNVTSKTLSDNAMTILKRWGFHPKRYIHDRSKYGWRNLYMVRLNRKESQQLKSNLDKVLKELSFTEGFDCLKYEGNGPTEI